jgi:hypothetical protein
MVIKLTNEVLNKQDDKIVCLKTVVYLVIMNIWIRALMKLSHNCLWWSKYSVILPQTTMIK